MFYYSYFSGRGRESLAHTLGDSDPFGLAPKEIIERILAAGFRPVADKPKSEPWRTIGTVTSVLWNNRFFMVAVSQEAQRISLQEMRETAYDPIE